MAGQSAVEEPGREEPVQEGGVGQPVGAGGPRFGEPGGGDKGGAGVAAASKDGAGGGNDGVFNFPGEGDGARVPYNFAKEVAYGAAGGGAGG